jgi:transglutaminase-like putative cysteine protease
MFGFAKAKRAALLQPAMSRPVAFTWLLCALFLVVLPHVARLPLWVMLVFCCFSGYRLLHDHAAWRLPPKWVSALFALIAVCGITINFDMPATRRAAIALLVVLLGLKLLETRTRRDVMVLSCIGYFLVVTNFLYSQSMGTALYLMVIVWLLTITLMHFQHLGDVNQARLRFNARQSVRLLAQAVPLMLILFIFFPRIDGPLWRLPDDSSAAVTGLSDRMSPGAITELSTSSAVAFRVEFERDVPPPALRYWRALVLWDYDGHTWQQGAPLSTPPIALHRIADPYTYTITLEPHEARWLLSLDLPYATVHHDIRIPLYRAAPYITAGTLNSSFELRTRRPINHLLRYTLQSYAHYRLDEIDDAMRERALQLPDRLHDRVRQLATQWRQASRRDQDVVQQALRYFREQPFTYTLTPPASDDDPTYEFLFDTRRGYCEHFASSFTVLMRAAGIPARVVIGYQGGEINPLGNHLTIRQSNAHAWSEVWLQGEGWRRVDPTAAVAPERIEMGPEALPEFSSAPFLLHHYTWLNRLWRGMRLGLDAVHYQWNRWVLQYSAKRQTEFMVRIGLGPLTWRSLTAVLVLLMSAMIGFFALRMFRRPMRRDPIVLAYQRFCTKLARRGLLRRVSEGPLDFAQRVKQQRPELASEVEHIVTLYSTLRYDCQQNTAQISRLRHAVRAFRP